MSVLDLMLDRERLTQMSGLARKFAAQTSFDQAFLKTWDIYASIVRGARTAASGQIAQPGQDAGNEPHDGPLGGPLDGLGGPQPGGSLPAKAA
jgi:hypothetical protein